MSFNQLKNEKSPYLIAHANNPINWYPWGKKAFDKAKKENKPIFLSIGYSSCHWCHVMAKESFEDEEVARLLNEYYVAIKVDKEERPDIDTIYMGVCVAINNSGGWPLTVIMTPDQKPFFVGTYFPKQSRAEGAGLLYILSLLAKKWNEENEEVFEVGEKITSYFRNIKPENNQVMISNEWFDKVIKQYEKVFDYVNGGFLGAPKFPPFINILFWLRMKNKVSLKMAEVTLLNMASSGLYDHIDGGFFRYATDEKWLIPHFEKMLYDNALAIITYLEAASVTSSRNNQAIFEQIAKETFNFLIKYFYQEGQGFYSSSSADADGEEGAYYLWSLDEIKKLFPDNQKIIQDLNLDQKLINNLSLPYLKLDKLNKNGYDPKILETLSRYRSERMHLALDKKIITTSNCLMIVALIKLIQTSKNKQEVTKYLGLANEILSFIEERIINNQGRLGTCYIDGKVSGDGYLDDYTYLSYVCLKLYEVTGLAEYLEKNHHLNTLIIDHFFDHDEGGFYLTSNFSEALIYRPKEINDLSTPSSNALLLEILYKVNQLIPNGYYQNIYQLHLDYMKKATSSSPLSSAYSLIAFNLELNPPPLIVYVTNKTSFQTFLKTVNKSKQNKISLIISKDNLSVLNRLYNYSRSYPLINDMPTYYLCGNQKCYPPFNDLNQLMKQLQTD